MTVFIRMIKGSLTSVIDTFGKNIFFSQKYVENGYTTGSRKVAKGHVPAIICTVKNVLFGHWFILARLLCFFFIAKSFSVFRLHFQNALSFETLYAFCLKCTLYQLLSWNIH